MNKLDTTFLEFILEKPVDQWTEEEHQKFKEQLVLFGETIQQTLEIMGEAMSNFTKGLAEVFNKGLKHE